MHERTEPDHCSCGLESEPDSVRAFGTRGELRHVAKQVLMSEDECQIAVAIDGEAKHFQHPNGGLRVLRESE
jgi:hypothetical protein